MKIKRLWARLFVVCVSAPLMAVMVASGSPGSPTGLVTELQEKKPDGKKAEVSEAESKAAQKISSAPDAAGKLKLAAEFVKKYPKSTLRPQVAGHVAGKIGEVADPAQQLALAEQFGSVFKETGEAELVYPVLVNAYVKASRADDAFRIAASMLEKTPDDATLLTQMTITGAQQAQRQNPKYIPLSQQYGARAAALMEADKKPAGMEDVRWKEYKTRWLPDLYLSMGVLSLSAGNASDAQTQLQKAASLNPSNPSVYALLGNLVNDQYQQTAQQFNAAPPGPAKDELLKKSQGQMEQVVDLYAHAAAVSEGVAQYQPLHDQIVQDLQTYYKYLHNGSTDGLQALIDKYKKPITPQ